MSYIALIVAGFILGMAINVFGLLGLSLLILPIYFIESLRAGLSQAIASTLLSATIFEVSYLCGVMTRGLSLSALAMGPNRASPHKRG